MTIRRIPALARRHGRAWPIALIVGFLPVLALLLLGYGHAAAQDTVWARQFGTAGPDRANRVAVDAQGNVYVVGQTSGTLPGQSWAGGLSDAYLKKYDGAANEVWLRQFGGTGDDDATAVAVDPLGYVYVAGRTGGESAGAMMLGGVSGAFLQKYDPGGAEVWGRQFGFENFAGASAVCVDSEGNIYVAGTVQGALPGQVALGPGDAFLRKYGSDGEELWTVQTGGLGADFASDVAVNQRGDAYLVGWSRNNQPDQGNAVSMNAFMSAVDRDGRTQWSNRLEAAGFSRSTAVDLDDAGNIYVSGWVSGVLAGQTQVGATDAFVGKYGPGGELIWARQFGTPDEERALDVVVGPGGAAWLVGWTRGVFLDQGEVPKRTVLVRRDGFARAYDGTGKALWTRQFGTLKDQSANGVALEDPFRRPAGQDPPSGKARLPQLPGGARAWDGTGGILVTGETSGPLFDQGSVGGMDVFLVKMAGGPSYSAPLGGPQAGTPQAERPASTSNLAGRELGITAVPGPEPGPGADGGVGRKHNGTPADAAALPSPTVAGDADAATGRKPGGSCGLHHGRGTIVGWAGSTIDASWGLLALGLLGLAVRRRGA